MTNVHSSLDKFDGLLVRLDPDRDKAGEKYEQIRWKLVKFFQWGYCHKAEELADETFDRVADKLAEEREDILDVPAYIWGVAKRVRYEAFKTEAKRVVLPERISAGEFSSRPDIISRDTSEAERRLRGLEKCMQNFSHSERLLLLQYHSVAGRRAEGRRLMAIEIGITLQALRVRANRLRFKVEQCLQRRLSSGIRSNFERLA